MSHKIYKKVSIYKNNNNKSFKKFTNLKWIKMNFKNVINFYILGTFKPKINKDISKKQPEFINGMEKYYGWLDYAKK
jgi:hypothetical protein